MLSFIYADAYEVFDVSLSTELLLLLVLFGLACLTIKFLPQPRRLTLCKKSERHEQIIGKRGGGGVLDFSDSDQSVFTVLSSTMRLLIRTP
jgi:hypothetical protein